MIKKITVFLSFISLLISSDVSSQKGNIQFQNYMKSGKNEMVNVFIRGNDDKIFAFTKSAGGTVKYKTGNYLAVHIHSAALLEMCKNEFVTHVMWESTKPVVLNDSMRLRNNIDSVHNGSSPLTMGYTGKNVIYGFIDTGVDFMHPDFMDSAGNTRIVSIWDQSMAYDALRTPPQYGYGQLWDSSDINSGTCLHIDDSGHGTNVTGCGAGNGLASGTHKGAAPDASIVIVESDFSAVNWLATVADAVDYIYNYADAQGLPCVINVSLGTYDGSHDGRDPAAMYIDSLIRSKGGRLMFCAAGNSGNIGSYHLETNVDADTSFTWFTYMPSGQSVLGYGAVFYELWADTADFNNVTYAIGMDDTTAGNYNFRGRTDFVNIQSHVGSIFTDTITNGTDTLAIVDFYAELQGDHYLLQVHSKEPDSSQYMFRFMTTGSGKFDVWSAAFMGTSVMVKDGLPSAAQMPEIIYYEKPDSSKIIVSSFTCLSSVITVGNYINNSQYIDYAGNLNVFPQIVGNISVNSSRGPTRDNRVKPDVVSPADPIFVAGILWVIDDLKINNPVKISPDGWHMRNGGTSLATPSVAGVGALMLEKCPQMNWEEFKDLLTGNAKSDSLTGITPNQSYGYGKVNAFRTLVGTNFKPSILGDTAFCFGGNTILSADTFYDNYLWNTSETTMTINVNSPMVINLEATDGNGCKGWSDTLQITELPDQVLILTQGGVMDQFIFASNPNGADYDWYQNGVLIGGLDDDTLLAPGNGNYFAVMTDAYGCQYTSDTINVVLSVEEENSDSNFNLIPNPNNGSFVVIVNNNINNHKLLIYNNLSQIIYSQNITNESAISLTDFADGIYFLRLESEGSVIMKKMIVTR